MIVSEVYTYLSLFNYSYFRFDQKPQKIEIWNMFLFFLFSSLDPKSYN